MNVLTEDGNNISGQRDFSFTATGEDSRRTQKQQQCGAFLSDPGRGGPLFLPNGAIYEEGLVTALSAGQPWPGSAFNPVGSAEPLPPLSIQWEPGFL